MMPFQVIFRILMFVVADFLASLFSVAGLKRGFEDTRGTLFFSIANIIREKINAGNPPRVLFWRSSWIKDT